MISSEMKLKIASAVSGDLSAAESHLLNLELKGNAAARRLYRDLMRNQADLRRLPKLEIRHSFVPAIMAAVQPKARKPSRWRRIDFSRWVSTAVVAATLLLCVAGMPQIVSLANGLRHPAASAQPHTADSPAPVNLEFDTNPLTLTTPANPVDLPTPNQRLSQHGANKEKPPPARRKRNS